MKRTSGSGKSGTLKSRQREERKRLIRLGWSIQDLPYSGCVQGGSNYREVMSETTIQKKIR